MVVSRYLRLFGFRLTTCRNDGLPRGTVVISESSCPGSMNFIKNFGEVINLIQN